MEAMQQLSNESFSYRWLINVKSSSETLDDSLRFSIDGGSFIEMDPNLIISMRWTSKETDHDFHFQQLPSSHGVVSADQIFSNGLLLPLPPPENGGATAALSRSLSLDSSESLLSRSNRHQSRNFNAVPGRSLSTPCSPLNATAAAMAAKSKLPSPKKILLKYLSLLLPLYKKVKGGLKLTTSPRKSNATKEIRSRNVVFDVCTETSIHDAVLYCKKSYVNPL